MNLEGVLRVLICAATIFAAASPSEALSLKKIIKDAGSIIKEAPKIINPITTPIQIVTGKQNPLDVKDFIGQQGQALGQIVQSGGNIISVPNVVLGQFANKVGGDAGTILFEIGTASNRFTTELGFTAAGQAASILKGQDALISLALPLAAAIKDAKSRLENQAQPLPDSVKTALRPIIPSEILDSARYVSETVTITLPGIINNGNRLPFFKDDNAVTVDNVIVFQRTPDFDDINDVVWLTHELYHVRQYKEWGIDLFAYNYLKNHKAVEDQAEAAASYARSYFNLLAGGQQIMGAKSDHRSAITFSEQKIQTPLGAGTVLVAHQGAPTGQNIAQPAVTAPSPEVTPPPDLASTTKMASICNIQGYLHYVDKQMNVIRVDPGPRLVAVGKVEPPLDPLCAQDMLLPGMRACVLQNGAIAIGYQTYGGCQICKAGQCP